MTAESSYSHGFGQSQYHVVLVPYKRFKMFDRADIRMQLECIFFAIAESNNFQIKAIEIMADHVHLFINIRPSHSIAEAIQYLKGGSSYELRKIFPIMKEFHRCRLWSRGKYFRPIGEVNEETIKHYIEQSQTKYHDNTRTSGAWLREAYASTSNRTPQTTLLAFTN